MTGPPRHDSAAPVDYDVKITPGTYRATFYVPKRFSGEIYRGELWGEWGWTQ